MTLSQLEGRVLQIAAAVAAGGPAAVRKAALSILTNVIMGTPVGNPVLWAYPAPPGYVGGRARANWFVNVNSPSAQVTEAIDPSGSATITTGAQIIAGFTQGGGSIHITNNLEYIIPLNNGHSKQAPSGYIEIAVATSLDAFKSEKFLNLGLGQAKKLL